MNKRLDLIDSLSQNLVAVQPVSASRWLAVSWLLGSGLLVITLTHWFGPIRTAAIQQLITQPQFFIETFLGVAAISALAMAAFKSAIPGELSKNTLVFAYGLIALWISFYVYGLLNPALSSSIADKRIHCVYESFIYSIPPILAAFYFTKRLYPLNPFQCSLAFSLAAAMLPALYMQIACMYEPQHILLMHILPGMAAALLGSLLGFALKK